MLRAFAHVSLQKRAYRHRIGTDRSFNNCSDLGCVNMRLAMLVKIRAIGLLPDQDPTRGHDPIV
eukprot:5372391-Lingulodinium_polyedra.AAC.1